MGTNVEQSGGVGVEFLVEAVGDIDEAEDEEELEADAAHVDVESLFDLGICVAGSRGHGCASGLDEEGNNVEEDKVEPKSPCLDPENFCSGGEVVDHAPENHIDKGIDP